MDRQTLRDRVHRYSAEGVEGLSNRRPARPGRRNSRAWCARVPSLRWTGRFAGGASTSSAGSRSASASPCTSAPRASNWPHPAFGQSAAPRIRSRGAGGVQEDFASTVAGGLPDHARGKPLEVWFQDEARVGQQGTLTRIRAPRGTRPRAPRDTRCTWACIFGAVRPERGATAALVLPHADTAAMNARLAEIARTVAEGAHAILVLDGASWHGSRALRIPDNITLLPLPPYAPELNPVENVRACLRANRLAISVFETCEDIVAQCCDAWNFFANDIATVRSITSRDYAKAVRS